MQSTIELCQSISMMAHKGQYDKGGDPYFLHPQYVADHVNTAEAKCVAYLHDVLEDTNITAGDLLRLKIPESIVKSVVSISKSPHEGYFHYLKRLKKDKIARIVKIQDLKHNSQFRRLNHITLEDIKRVIKYTLALIYLYTFPYPHE